MDYTDEIAKGWSGLKFTFGDFFRAEPTGPPSLSHYEGLPALLVPFKITTELEKGSPAVMDGRMMVIHDRPNHRRITILHSKDSVTDRVLSTLNLAVGKYRK